jgi:hypothetical protein
MSVGFGGYFDADVSRETSTARTVSPTGVPHSAMFHVKHSTPECARFSGNELLTCSRGGVSGCPCRVRTHQELTDHDRDPSDDLGR